MVGWIRRWMEGWGTQVDTQVDRVIVLNPIIPVVEQLLNSTFSSYIYTFCVCDFAIFPFKIRSLLPLLSLVLALDFLWPAEYGRSDNVLIPKRRSQDIAHCTNSPLDSCQRPKEQPD